MKVNYYAIELALFIFYHQLFNFPHSPISNREQMHDSSLLLAALCLPPMPPTPTTDFFSLSFLHVFYKNGNQCFSRDFLGTSTGQQQQPQVPK